MIMSRVYDKDTIIAKELYKELSSKKKREHFWEYYKNVIFVAIFLVVLAGIGYLMSPTPTPEGNLRIKFVNVYMDGLVEGSNPMELDYESYLGAENTCQMAFSHSEISAEDETQSGMNMEDMMIQVVTCNLEVFVFDEFAMNKLCPTGFVLDLNTCLDKEVINMMEERLVYQKDVYGNIVPMAIDITDTSYVKEMGIQGEGVYISFVANSPNPEVAKEFVTYTLLYSEGKF